MAVACQDEAGPYQTVPYAGPQWAPVGHPPLAAPRVCAPGHGQAAHAVPSSDGPTQAQGVTPCPNAVLHPWLKAAVRALLAMLPEPAPVADAVANQASWTRWQAGLRVRVTLPAALPRLRLLLVWDNLTGHHTPELLLWLFAQGVMVLYTPLAGSWLNMAESLQRILVRRALAGQHPQSPQDIMDALEATARAWNADPTPFTWGGGRAARRVRARQRRHALGGSGACSARSFRCRPHGYVDATDPLVVSPLRF